MEQDSRFLVKMLVRIEMAWSMLFEEDPSIEGRDASDIKDSNLGQSVMRRGFGGSM